MEDSSNIKVFCRFRPLNDKELQITQNYCVNFLGEQTVAVNSHNENSEQMRFIFDKVFSPTSSQEKVYQQTSMPIVNSVLQGFNGAILAYGQTSSGKTFTMTGPLDSDSDLMGIIPRMINTVFLGIAEAAENIEFSVKVAYCEIYMEKIRDLLDTSKNNLKIHESRTKGVYIEGLSEFYVSSEREVFDLMNAGAGNREVGCTNMNEGSSRSHSLFLMTVAQTDDKDLSGKVGKLYLVDLAGSEKISKTGAAGKRLEEAKTINKSLTVLGQVIYSLTDGKSTHIPYRNSKLTRVLQDSLGGNSKTCLIVTCSPSSFNESETISTLRFGVRAKAIKNKPKINREHTTAELKLMLSKAQEEIEKRDQIISKLENRLKISGMDYPEISKNEKLNEKIDYEEVLIEIEDLRVRLSEEVENGRVVSEENRLIVFRLQQVTDERDLLATNFAVLQESFEKLKDKCQEQDGIIERMSIEKEALAGANEGLVQRRIMYEQVINERDAEINDLRLHLQGSIKRTPEIVNELKAQIEFEKEKSLDLNEKIKSLESNLQENLKMLKDAGGAVQEKLIIQAVEQERKKWAEEKKTLVRDLKNRINKVIELEIALDSAKENYEILERYLPADKKRLKQRCEVLSKNLDQLTDLYQQIVREKSKYTVDLKVLERKNIRLTERNILLEADLKKAKETLSQATSKIKILEEQTESFSRNSANVSRPQFAPINIKKMIKGGMNSHQSSLLV